MKILAVLLSLSLAPGAAAQGPAGAAASVELATAPYIAVSTITVTAPRPRSADEIRVLKTARAGGAAVGAAGAGLMVYTVVFGLTGPFGWAASLIFLGGMTAYLSHRRLRGYDDFPKTRPPAEPRPPEGPEAPVSTAAYAGAGR